jgi:KipI family sensor histidine kinase inhibitor
MQRQLLEYGESALLLECADLDEVLGVRAQLERDPIAEIDEIIPGARTLLLRLSSSLSPAQRERLLSLRADQIAADDAAPIEIEVDYSGEDLDEVAQLTGLSPDQVIEAHAAQSWTVGFCGFAPGFAYLHGENDRLQVPRRSSPRKRVPLGSVGLADQWSGVYPREGPGGWQLIGRTDRTLWDLDQSPPALLQPGMRVRFRRREP